MVLNSDKEFTNDSDKTLWAALEAGATVITANKRLARDIAMRWGQTQQERGHAVWESPDIIPWGAYVLRTADRLRAHQERPLAPLTDAQERWLWTDLVHAQNLGFLCADQAFGGLAAEAWQLLADHALALPPAQGGAETEAFVAIARAFRAWLRSHRREDRAGAGLRIASAWQEGVIAPPALLVWVGFQRLNPTQERLHASAQARGSRSQILPLGHCGGAVKAHSFTTVDNEFTTALLWARERLSQAPEGRYGIVVPELERYRLMLARLATEILGTTVNGDPRYELSLGTPLSRAPVVMVARRIWQLLQGSLDATAAALLIQSPFLGGAARERGERAQLAWTVLSEGRSLSIRELAGLVRKAGAPEQAAACDRLVGLARTWPRFEGASVWAGLMMKALHVFGWLGDIAGPGEYQAGAALRDALEAVAGLDAVTEHLSYADVLAAVEADLSQRIFQAGVDGPEARVQIMGPLEAVGLTFDGLWVANLHDRAWPAVREPHPLLPLSFQREHGLPHADIAEDVRYAKDLITDLVGAAPLVHVSVAGHDGSDPQRPSPVLAGFGLMPAPEPDFMGRAARLFAARPLLEDIPENPAPLTDPRARTYGVALFAAQAACPFKAAAQYRLKTSSVTAPAYGVAPFVRGAIVHAALQYLFQWLPDQAALAALSEADKEQVIVEAVARAMAEAMADYEDFPERFRALEEQHYRALVREFIHLEEGRGPFRVKDCEQEVTFACGPLEARGRIDRIDEVAGRLILIDYKTGRTPALDLSSDRPLHPQLLFYAAALGPSVGGLVYASLKAQGASYKAWACAPDMFLKATVVPDWDRVAAAWPQLLAGLAEEFAQGCAQVMPQKSACDYCGHESLCRVGEIPDDEP